ncbi:MAG TPA: threonine synthase, partial [Phenylobacterium sp.]|nr:threonine synthase [Phenylobacterium sp.]
GTAVGEGDTSRTIVATLNETGQMIDPHTAVAVAAFNRTRGVTEPVIILSTAHAAKFPEAVHAATGETPATPRKALHLAGKAERYDRLPADADVIKTYVRAFAEG